MSTIHPAFVNCDIPVFYATTEGQTRRIAERLAAMFREKGFVSRAFDVASAEALVRRANDTPVATQPALAPCNGAAARVTTSRRAGIATRRARRRR